MAKIVLLNAHKELWFGKSLYFFIFRRPWKAKYKFYLKYHSACEDAYILSSSDMKGIRKLFEILHIKIWAILNGFNFLNVKLVSQREIKDDDILLIQHIGNFTSYEAPVCGDRIISFLNSMNCKKYVMMNHHPYHIESGAQNLKKLNFTGFILEANLNDGQTFYFDKIGIHFKDRSTVIMPFVVRDEFYEGYKQRKFHQSTNNCLCIGTQSLNMSHDASFVNYFGHANLQPLRKQIREGALNHLPLNNLVSHINEGGKSKSARQAKGFSERLRALYHNAFVYGQRGYHKMNIVEAYLNSNFHIVGEEVTGLPGIGAFEGMATGSILIGIEDGTYERFGMQSGVHYIGHDGTLNSIEKAVQEAISMDEYNLCKMSEAAHKFALEKCSGKIVYENLRDGL